jgi:hypothetical protein
LTWPGRPPFFAVSPKRQLFPAPAFFIFALCLKKFVNPLLFQKLWNKLLGCCSLGELEEPRLKLESVPRRSPGHEPRPFQADQGAWGTVFPVRDYRAVQGKKLAAIPAL